MYDKINAWTKAETTDDDQIGMTTPSETPAPGVGRPIQDGSEEGRRQGRITIAGALIAGALVAAGETYKDSLSGKVSVPGVCVMAGLGAAGYIIAVWVERARR